MCVAVGGKYMRCGGWQMCALRWVVNVCVAVGGKCVGCGGW